MRLGVLLDERLDSVRTRRDPCAAVEPGSGIGFVTRHGDGRASLQRKRDHTRRAAGLKFQFFRKRRHGHAQGGVRSLRSGSGITDVFYFGVRVGGAGDHPLVLAVPPGVGDHAVSGRKGSGGNRGVADTGLRGGVGIRSLAEPRAFFDQALEAAGPLTEEFVHIVGAHLVHDQEHNELWPGRRFCRLGNCHAKRRSLTGRTGRKQYGSGEKNCRGHRRAGQKSTL